MNPFVRALTLVLSLSILAGTVSAQSPAGSSRPKRIQPPSELERGPRHQRRIALTFDACGGNEELPALLRVLERENVIATFFLTGKWAGEFPESASRIVAQGHVIGNHTWGHKDLTKLTDSEIAQELHRADDQFVRAFGCRYFPLLRTPFGEGNGRVLRVVEKHGFRSVRWSIDTLDSIEPRKTASFIQHRVLDRSDEDLCGAIVLMHVGFPETCAALPVMIRSLRERGFEFVPVSTWVARPPSILAKSRVSALMHGPSLRALHLSSSSGFLLDDQAVKSVSPTSALSAPDPQALRIWHRWASPPGIMFNHRNTTTKP